MLFFAFEELTVSDGTHRPVRPRFGRIVPVDPVPIPAGAGFHLGFRLKSCLRPGSATIRTRSAGPLPGRQAESWIPGRIGVQAGARFR